jgi:HK97 family phage prohead protease
MNRAYAVLQLKALDATRRTFAGIATTPSTDRTGDVIEPKGAKFKLPLPLLWQHDAKQPIGWVRAARVSADGIEIDGEIAHVPEAGALQDRLTEAWQSIKAGLVRGLSIGFNELQDGKEPINPKDPWGPTRFKAWEWLELSAVTIPANQDASITTIKSAYAQSQAVPGRSAATPRLSIAGAAARKGNSMEPLHTQLTGLQESRRQKSARMEELLNVATEQKRDLTDEEKGEFDEHTAEIKRLDPVITLKTIQIGQASTAVAVDTRQYQRAPMGFVRRQDPDDVFKGQSETRKIIVKALAHLAMRGGNFVRMSEIAEQRYGKTHPTLVQVIKANEVPGLASGSGEPFSELVSIDNRYTGDFIDFLYSMTVFDQLPLRVVPANVGIKGIDGAFTGYWVGESKAIPMSNGSASITSTSPLKVAAITTISNELLEDSSPAAERMVRDGLAEASAQRIDQTFLSTAAAVAGVSPAGILNGLTPGTSAGGSISDIIEDWKTLTGVFITAKNYRSGTGLYIVTTPAVAESLGLVRNALGQMEFTGVNALGGTFMGRPVVTGDNVGAGDFIVLKPDEIWKIGDSGVRVTLSQEATIEQSTAPTGAQDTPTAASQAMVNMYQEESTAFKVVRRINWGKRRTPAAAYIGDADYGSVGS